MRPLFESQYVKRFFLGTLVFPERPGATQKFLGGLQTEWNVSLFHYRNHGDGKGKRYSLAQP